MEIKRNIAQQLADLLIENQAAVYPTTVGAAVRLILGDGSVLVIPTNPRDRFAITGSSASLGFLGSETVSFTTQ